MVKVIKRCIATFTDDDRAAKDELLFPLGSWHGDIVGQAGEPVHETDIMEGIVVETAEHR